MSIGKIFFCGNFLCSVPIFKGHKRSELFCLPGYMEPSHDLTADLGDFLSLYFLDFIVALDALWSKSPKMSIFPTNVTVCCIQLVSSFYWKLQQLALFSILVVFLTKDQNKLSLLNFWSGLFPNSLCTLQREIRYCFLWIFIPTYDPPTYTKREILENKIAFNLYFPIHSFLPTKVEEILQTNGSERFVEQLGTHFLVSAVENKIKKCGRTVFADTSVEVNRKFAYLSKYYSALEFFK